VNFPFGPVPETLTGTLRITLWLRRRFASGPAVDQVFINSKLGERAHWRKVGKYTISYD
jgi:hypothetical protein